MISFYSSVFLLVITVVSSSPTFFKTQGSYYQIGYSVGYKFRDQIKNFINESTTYNSVLLPFYNTTWGKNIVQQYEITNKNLFPNYFEELRGISDGAEEPFINMLLLNLRPEIETIVQETKIESTFSLEHCTDIHVRTETNKIFGHNEDADPKVKDYAYIVHAIIEQNGTVVENWVAYCYPGILPGIAFGFNAHLALSLNALTPKTVIAGGAARAFVNRSFFAARSITETLNQIATHMSVMSFGFSLNVGQFSDGSIANIEVSPFMSGYIFVHGNYSHYNNYKLLAEDLKYYVSISTLHRSARVDQFPVPKTSEDILTILGDHEDAVYPIYRDGSYPDDTSTIASALFDLDKGKISIFDANPKTSAPFIILDVKSLNQTLN
eukprot:TRINITY_DN13126_c0_g1_i1.p1 TRINITY_DN13126_c0_g1~~TRINITY_DN13126_c0_g1_i1.p1  ORF type:complete len:381 (-),score=50.65 TRINITY_DN13126_c0_g1_i1:27-1169(-)